MLKICYNLLVTQTYSSPDCTQFLARDAKASRAILVACVCGLSVCGLWSAMEVDCDHIAELSMDLTLPLDSYIWQSSSNLQSKFPPPRPIRLFRVPPAREVPQLSK